MRSHWIFCMGAAGVIVCSSLLSWWVCQASDEVGNQHIAKGGAPMQENVPDETKKGRDVLLRCAEAYSKLPSYVGTTSTVFEASYGQVSHSRSASAKVYFSRPGKIRIEGPKPVYNHIRACFDQFTPIL